MTDRAVVSSLEKESQLKKRKQDKLVFVDAVEQIIRDSMWSSVLYRAMPLAVAGISIHAAITARPFLFKRPDNFRATAIKLILQSFFIGTSLYVIGRLSSKPSTDAKLRAAGFKTEDGSWTPHAYKLRDLSVNEEYAPRQNDGKCGYCKSEGRDRVTHGMWAHNLSVADYQGLLDRGWRRSGKYCYKPVLNQICCPQYTIRCRIEDFKASKSQRKTLNALLHFLKDDKEHANKSRPEKVVVYSKDNPFVPPVKLPVPPENCSGGDSVMRGREKRRMRKRRKLLTKGIDPAKNPRSTLQQRSLDSMFEEIFCSTTTATRKLTVETMRSCPESDRFKETFSESYKLAVKYQKIIHKEGESDWTVSRYRNFLVECPLPPQKSSHSQHPGYGAFHQHYRLNGNLIAVGVIDILPSCVSSKYLYYDPAYSHLSLGTVSALHEIYYTRILHGYTANLRYYYMGYYIHMNQKMKYKGNYTPSDLLCPETYAWISIETCRKKLDIQKYCKFSDVETMDDSASVSEADLTALQRLLFMNKLMSYSEYEALRRVANKELTADEKNDLVDYVKLVGRRLANRMINCVD